MKDKKIIVNLTPEEYKTIISLIILLRHVVVFYPQYFENIVELMNDIEASYLLLHNSKYKRGVI